MSKLTSLAIGLMTVVLMAPNSQAMTTTSTTSSVQKPAGDLHAQLIIKIGGNSDYSYRGEYERRREIELEREREAYRRREYYANRRYHRHYGEYRGESKGEYRGEYRGESKGEYRGESKGQYRRDRD
jgi:hypothetical protein